MEIHIKKGLDALQTETVLRLLSQTVWACNRKKEAIITFLFSYLLMYHTE